jgi:hypothetical protein
MFTTTHTTARSTKTLVAAVVVALAGVAADFAFLENEVAKPYDTALTSLGASGRPLFVEELTVRGPSRQTMVSTSRR